MLKIPSPFVVHTIAEYPVAMPCNGMSVTVTQQVVSVPADAVGTGVTVTVVESETVFVPSLT